MNLGDTLAVVLLALYIGTLVGIVLKFVDYHVPPKRIWLAVIVPIELIVQPFVLLMMIDRFPADFRKRWNDISFLRKVRIGLSFYKFYIMHLPIAAAILAQSLAEAFAVPDRSQLVERPMPTRRPPSSSLTQVAWKSSLEFERFYRGAFQ